MSQVIQHSKSKKLADSLEKLFGDNLISVCEYGASVFEPMQNQQVSNHKNVNVLVILKSLTPADLEKASSIAKQWQKEANALPIFMSQKEWAESQDIFALEYADIRDRHHVIFGEDFYSFVEVDKTSLRLVCELELHQKLMFMRQRWLIHKDNPKILLELLKDTINSFSALFRGIIRLRMSRETIPYKPHDVFNKLAELVPQYNAAPFLEILEVTAPSAKVQLTEISELYGRFVQELMHVVDYINQEETVVTAE